MSIAANIKTLDFYQGARECEQLAVKTGSPEGNYNIVTYQFNDGSKVRVDYSKNELS